MSLECFTWITQLLGSLVHKLRHKDEGIFTRLPDCLIIDILSRLPEDCLVRCQRDCRVWKALISSQYFATLYLRRAKPVLIIQCDRGITNHEQNLFVFDESLNNKEKITFRKVLLKRELMINKDTDVEENSFTHFQLFAACLSCSCQWSSAFDREQRFSETKYSSLCQWNHGAQN
uniref:Uncharacterized protein LOC104243785 isoform X3 n=1 Tax=Nicotiana sylvestris TaxID=4096 RepID=A0A1U7XZE6_NICSY|nr:PREDICTED: uncharacterized protein LOC104243785 isoform X3 [Nicotiana sylvestris]